MPSDPGSRPAASSDNGTLIYSTFNTPTGNRHDGCVGETVVRPGAGLDGTQEVAMAFVPASDTTLKRVRLATSAPGASNGVEISLLADASGPPGAVRGSFTLTQFIVPGTCRRAAAVLAHGSAVPTGYLLVGKLLTPECGADGVPGRISPEAKRWSYGIRTRW